MYLIRGLCPRTDVMCGAHYFNVELSRDWPSLVEASGITQENVDHVIETNGRAWLDACGFKSSGLFDPRTSIRVAWGSWGTEHITVPGNACGLDIDHSDHSFGCFIENGRMLLPHNIDSWNQKNLLLIVFTEFAESIVCRSGDRMTDAELIQRARNGETIGGGAKQIALLVAAYDALLCVAEASHKRRDALEAELVNAKRLAAEAVQVPGVSDQMRESMRR